MRASLQTRDIDDDAEPMSMWLEDLAEQPDSIEAVAAHAYELERRVGHDVVALLVAINSAAQCAGVRSGSRRWLHYGLTSSDVVDAHVARAIEKTTREVLHSLDNMREQAYAASAAGMTPGRTHGRYAAPTSWQHRMAVLLDRVCNSEYELVLAERSAAVVAFSGAVGHVSGRLQDETRSTAAEILGLRLCHHSTQVVPRFRPTAWAKALASVGDAVRDLSTQVRLAAISGVDELRTNPSTHYVGSSAMPGKVNPTQAETACGLATMARHYAAAVSETSVLWFDRDIGHSSVDRIALPGAAHCVSAACDRLSSLLRRSQLTPAPLPDESLAAERMMQATRDGVCRWDTIG